MNLSYSNLYTQAFFQAKISPSAQYIANVTANRIVIRRLGDDLSILNVFECSKPVNYIQWSPNSECILAINYEFSRIEVYSIVDPKWTATIKDSGFTIVSVKWTFDSKSLICTSEMSLRVSIWNLSKKELKYISCAKYQDKAIETSPDGKYVAIVHKRSGKDALSIYHSSSFILLQHFELGTVDLENIKWSPDSSCLAVWDNCLYNTLMVYRPDGHVYTTYQGYEYGLGIKTVDWCQNEKFLAIGNYDETIHLLSTMSWKLITVLNHPSVLSSQTTNIALYEEVGLPKPQGPAMKTHIAYRLTTKRPFNIPTTRTEYNQPNSRMGVGICHLSTDGLYIASRNDTMPTVLWIWDTKTLACRYVVVFKNAIKQLLWNPVHTHLLAVGCGDQNIHFIQPTVGGINLVPSTMNTGDFFIRKVKWSPNGKSLLLLDQHLFCLTKIDA